MAINYRYTLRFSTDLALYLFLFFAAGALLWTADEFLNWNVLPDWIDKYAQLIIILFGIAVGLCVCSCLLSSVVLIAESLAQRAGMPDYTVPPRVWRYAVGAIFLTLGVFLIFSKVDEYRKGVADRHRRAEELQEYRRVVEDLQTAANRVPELFPRSIAEEISRGTTFKNESDLVQFLTALRSSTPHHPTVSVLSRAAPPYEYCHWQLVAGRARNSDRPADFEVAKQFYIGFPSAIEKGVVAELFNGQVSPVNERLEGEVIDNVRAGSWRTIEVGGKVAAIVVFRTELRAPSGSHHFGPAVPAQSIGQPATVAPAQTNAAPAH